MVPWKLTDLKAKSLYFKLWVFGLHELEIL